MNGLDKLASLTPQTRRIMCDKATEHPFSGAYNQVVAQGTYLCRRCGLALFRAHSQFSAGCGWPSFDADIAGNVHELLDEDGLRMEIVCQRCQGHLGHVFAGEQLTPRNRRYCVNSLALDFVTDETVFDSEEAILAGGCFWGVEHSLSQLPGVLNVEVGYTGGHLMNPTYPAVCQGDSGHYEAVRVLYDPGRMDYRAVLTRFFEIHDPTQAQGQGPDRGPQYRSAVFYYTALQQNIAQQVIAELTANGTQVATQLLAVTTFWPAEASHQHYYRH
jgi:peptide methionine sulfoxide reductase msrA/msrB